MKRIVISVRWYFSMLPTDNRAAQQANRSDITSQKPYTHTTKYVFPQGFYALISPESYTKY